MDKIIYFDYCALIVLIIICVSVSFRRVVNGRQERYFLFILLISIAANASDICAVTLDNMGDGHVAAKYIAHTIYLLTHNLMTPFYLCYLVAQIDTWHKLNKNKVLRALISFPALFVTALLILNFFTHNVFYIGENDEYVRGSLFFIMYLVPAFYAVFAVIYAFKYRMLFSRYRLVSQLAIFPLMFMAAVIQFIYPRLLVEMFANAMGILFVVMVIQRPGERIDTDTGLNKQSIYRKDIKRGFLNSKPMDIIMVNITNYQAVRDMLGYEGINDVLSEIAGQLVALNREKGLNAELYHIGMGKFSVVSDGGHFDRTEEAARLINNAMKYDYRLRRMEINLVACVCVVRCPQDIQDAESLLAFENNIDAGMYTGQVLYASNIYKKEYYDVVRDINRIIESALVNKKFTVYYQPIYSVEEKRFNSAEALLRLKDERYGFISPEVFIPAAEKSGAIHRIGEYVLEEVCRFISGEEFKELGIDYIEVNLSVVQCMQNNLASEILGMLRKYNVSTDKINLEITETAAACSQNTMMDNLNELMNAGISFSLDDFGTGYSNMRRIASLPFDIVKLDKSFTNIHADSKMMIVLENTIRMIKAMNMKIVVEGIETKNMVRQFADLKCEYIQGYYYSKPIPKEEFVDFINSSAMSNETV